MASIRISHHFNVSPPKWSAGIYSIRKRSRSGGFLMGGLRMCMNSMPAKVATSEFH